MAYQLVDGTWVEENSATGATTVVSGPGGEAPLVDSSILSSFMRDAFGTLNVAIRSSFAMAPATPPPVVNPNAAALGSLITPQVKTLLTVAVIAFVAKKIFFP